MSAPRGQEVGSVARAIAILDALADHQQGLGVNELARRLGVNASTASRLLATLERGELVEREPGGPYRLGLRLVALADGVLARLDVRELARLDLVPAESSVTSVARLGLPSVAHATATGKVMLAFADPGEAVPSRDELTVYTDRTITDPDALAEEIAAVRREGWAQACGEREPDLNALAAPVFGRGGALRAILGLQGPAARLDAERRREVLPTLIDAAAALSRALGGAPRRG